MPTEKQKRLIGLLLENIGKPKPKLAGEMLRECGYSEAICKNPKLILDSETIKKELEPVVLQLKKARRKAINKLNKTIDKAKYRDLIDGVDKLTKNIQLLGDKPTENINIYDQEQIKTIADRVRDNG